MSYKFLDTAALAVEILRKNGLRAEMYPSPGETADTPLVVVQDAGPVDIRGSRQGRGTNTVISIAVVADDPDLCTAVADKATSVLVEKVGQYENGRLVSGKAVNFPRPVGQNVLGRDNLYQRHSMVKIITRNITKE